MAQVTPCELGGPADVGDVARGRSAFTRRVVGVQATEQGRLATGPERRRFRPPGRSRFPLPVRLRDDRRSFERLENVGPRRIEPGETAEITLRAFQRSFQAFPLVSWSTIRQWEILPGHFDSFSQAEGREGRESGLELRIVTERLPGQTAALPLVEPRHEDVVLPEVAECGRLHVIELVLAAVH